MSSHKILVVESEKSPKVFSTNWREDLALRRNLQVLDRDEYSIVNRITVDQKILLKRFQTKLGRSKMSYARATGNMELQKRLRDGTTFVLNTNVGSNDKGDETLKRIWGNGKQTYEKRVSTDKFLKKRQIGAFTCIEDDTESEPVYKKDSVPTRPLTSVNLRPDTVVTIAKPIINKRPYTAIEHQYTEARISEPLPDIEHLPDITIEDPTTEQPNLDCHQNAETVQSVSVVTKEERDTKPRPQTAHVTITTPEKEDATYVCPHNTVRRRPSTAGAVLHTVSKPSPQSTNINQHRTKPSKSAKAHKRERPAPKPVSTNAGIGSMFQNPDFEITLLDFQRFLVYSSNYEKRVKVYGDRVKTLAMDNAVDYYTAKIQDSVRNAKKKLHMEAAMEATPEDIKRETGNLMVRSMTIKTLDLS